MEAAFTFIATGEQPDDEPQESDDNYIIYQPTDKELDITDMVLDELSVNLPMKAVCSDSCKGVCPACGINLNKKACQCRPASHHPAWDTLLQLKEK